MKIHTLGLAAAALGILHALGCSSDSTDAPVDNPTTDSGTQSDGGTTPPTPTTDSGLVTDSGTSTDSGVVESLYPHLTGTPTLSATSVAVGATITITAPVNDKAHFMHAYLGCQQHPELNLAGSFAEVSNPPETAKGTKAAGANTISATLTIPDNVYYKDDPNQKCRFGIELLDTDIDYSLQYNYASYTWDQKDPLVKSDTMYIEYDTAWQSPNHSDQRVSPYDIPFFAVTF